MPYPICWGEVPWPPRRLASVLCACGREEELDEACGREDAEVPVCGGRGPEERGDQENGACGAGLRGEQRVRLCYGTPLCGC